VCAQEHKFADGSSIPEAVYNLLADLILLAPLFTRKLIATRRLFFFKSLW
jgi:hypothetical protein